MKKLWSCLICFGIALSLIMPMSCLADTSSAVFIEYLSGYNQIPTQNTYTHNWWKETSKHGNEGIVASKITDFDSDGSNELLIFVLNWDNSVKRNALDFIIVENNNGCAVEQSRVRLSGNSSCFNNYLWEDMKITFYNNCVGYYYKARIVEGFAVDYKACTYDGNNINTIVHLLDPGYTASIGLYDVTDCSERDYYEKGTELYFEDDAECSGVYNSYTDAVNERMAPAGINSCYAWYTCYKANYYGPVGSFANTEILSSLKSDALNMQGEVVTSVATFDVYSNVLKEVAVTLNGEKMIFDQSPVVVDGRTLVPLRAIFEALGATVEWNGTTQTVTSTKDGTIISMTIGKTEMYKNGEKIALDIAPQIVGGRTLVPVRAVAEGFGVSVDWNGETNTVILNEY